MRGWLSLALVAAPAASAVDFETEIRPLLETRCLHCHTDANKLGELSLETLDAARQGGAGGPAIVPGQPDRSSLYARMRLAPEEPGSMPPGGPQIAADGLAKIHAWILEGAAWPGALGRGTAPADRANDDEETALVRRLHARIAARAREASQPFEAYDEAVPGAGTALRMVPIPAGEFTQGTPAGESGRGADEGPPRRVRLDAFWMGAHEISWDAFRQFMLREAEGYQDPDGLAAAVSSPTPPYVEMSFGMGVTGFPAISMTQHAASKYAQWLSAKTGHFYRLPTEAEWEYACRAGSDAAYSFGDDPAELGEFGWHWENSGMQYRPIGTRKPNAWGLHDMHGNVWEWTLDQYEPTYSADREVQANPWVRADRLYPRVARGGSWRDDATALRCGARRASDGTWKMQDPQLPKSVWYHTDAQWLGFRLVRPVGIPSPEAMHAYWNSASGKK